MIHFPPPKTTIIFSCCDFYLNCHGLMTRTQYGFGHTMSNKEVEVEINYFTKKATFSKMHIGYGWVIVGFSDINIPSVGGFISKSQIL